MTTIYTTASDQLLVATVLPTLAQNNVESVRLFVEFDEAWDGYPARSAVFTTSISSKPHEVTISSGFCLVPQEVLAGPCRLYIAVKGVNNKGEVKSSTRLTLKVSEGAPSVVISDPTQSVYHQIATEGAVLSSRMSELEKAGTVEGSEVIGVRTGADGKIYPTAGDAVRGQIEKVEREHLKLTGQTKIAFTAGGNIKLSYNIGEVVDITPEAVTYYLHAIVPASAGDKFTLTAAGGDNPRTWGFVSERYELLSVAAPSLICEDAVVTAPEGAAWLIINSRDSYIGECYVGEGRLHAVERGIDVLTEDRALVFTDGKNIKLSYNIGEVVNLTPEEIADYRYVIEPCVAGDVFKISVQGGENPRAWGFLDENNVLLAVAPRNTAGQLLDGVEIIAPAGVAKVIINDNKKGLTSFKYFDSHALRRRCELLEETEEELVGQVETLRSKTPYYIHSTPDEDIATLYRGDAFAKQLKAPIADFAKPGDLMVHVSTFAIIDDVVYCTYYANTRSTAEEPTEHTARLVYCPLSDTSAKTYIDLQDVGDTFDGKTVTAIYDTILLRKDDKELYLMWTAQLNGVYYRLYRTFNVNTKALGPIAVNQFYVGETGGDWSTKTMEDAFKQEGVEHKPIKLDIGIMQKLSTREENGETWYYTGAYALAFNCIIKSKDLITWYYVAAPDFDNASQFENATYVIGDKVFYFVRQEWANNTGFLTYYDLNAKTWAEPVYVYDCQSRSDFFHYDGSLYLIHAPKDRSHISIMKINQTYLNQSYEVQTARVPDYFYPYALTYKGMPYMSFTKSRKHIYLSPFTIQTTTTDAVVDNLMGLLAQ